MSSLLNFPELATAHGAALDRATVYVHWLMLVLFLGWGAYFVYVLFRFRASANPEASYEGTKSHFSTYVEGAIIFAEAVLLLGFSFPLWAARVDEFPAEEDAIVVRVVAEQFAWNAHYPGADGKFGPSRLDLIDTESNPLGIDRDHPDGADDITTVNQMHLPVGKPAIIHLSAKDVIHSFGVPEFRVKQDAIPGMSIPMWFVPNVTTEEMRKIKNNPDFNYEIACAQLCGLGHYRMRGFVTVHEEAGFQAFLDEEASFLGGDDEDVW